MNSYKHIAVGIDFSAQSLVALERALSIAKRNDAVLLIISVIDTHSFGSVPAYDLAYAAQLKEDREREVAKLKENALKEGVLSVKTIVQFGSPKEIMTTLTGVDLIVVSATGLNRFEKMLLGSNAERIVRNAPCDVLVVRH